MTRIRHRDTHPRDTHRVATHRRDIRRSTLLSTVSRRRNNSNPAVKPVSWKDEKFQTQSEAEKPNEEMLNGHQASEGHTGSFRSLEERSDKGAPVEEIHQFQCPMQIEMQILDEKIRLWSIGKEADIPLLLSSLHHILWPNSGWSPITLANIIESSQVKKAYQKAQLCLHPDKLQQRGSTLSQKHIAEKAFSILQETIYLQYFQEGITTKITKGH